MSNETRTRAPRGGITIEGIFYRGGQFLPANEPQRGKFNRATTSKPKTARKVEIEPYKWVVPPDGKRSIFTYIGGIVATFDRNGDDPDKMVFCGTPQIMKYYGRTEQESRDLIERYNNGERFF